eukprot:Hpha_TRINITY_DN16239_c0_g4::TRINITY_DN16239_c0_g4_i1::g.14569::m.14569
MPSSPSSSFLISLCPKPVETLSSMHAPQPPRHPSELVPAPDAERRVGYKKRREERIARERNWKEDYERADEKAGELLGKDYEAKADAMRRAAEDSSSKAEAPEVSNAPVKAEELDVPFVDPDGDSVVVSAAAEGSGMQYSINGELRPPSRQVSFDKATGLLRFKDINKGIVIPPAGRDRLLSKLYRLAEATDVEHDLQLQGEWAGTGLGLEELEREKEKAVEKEDYGEAGRLLGVIRKAKEERLGDLKTLKKAAVAREDFETASKIHAEMRTLNASLHSALASLPSAEDDELRVGAVVRLLKPVALRGGKQISKGTTGLVERIPGTEKGSVATVRMDGVLFDAREGQLKVASAPRLRRRKGGRRRKDQESTAGEAVNATLTLEKDNSGKVGVSYVGVTVQKVTEGSQAERAGVLVGSRILKVGGTAVGNAAEVTAAIEEAGDVFQLEVQLPSGTGADFLGEDEPRVPAPSPRPRAKKEKDARASPAPTPVQTPKGNGASATEGNATVPEQKAAPFEVGQTVRMRDSSAEDWKTGVVTSVRGDGRPVVALRDGSSGFTWGEVLVEEGCPGGSLAACSQHCQQKSDLRKCLDECLSLCMPSASQESQQTVKLAEETRVEALETFQSDSAGKGAVEVRKGIRGVVELVDPGGDALIRFDGIPLRQWVFSRHFRRLLVVDQCTEVNSTIAAEIGFAPVAIPLHRFALPDGVAVVSPFAPANASRGWNATDAVLVEFSRLLYSGGLRSVENLTVVDVGAGVGEFTVRAAALLNKATEEGKGDDRSVRMVAVEPLGLNLLALRCGVNSLGNDTKRWVSIQRTGLGMGMREDCSTVSLPDDATNAAVRCGVARFSGSRAVRDHQVALQRGDEVLGKRRVHFLRVATGGDLLAVLEGFSGVFDESGVDFAVVQVPAGAAGEAEGVWKFLFRRGFIISTDGFNRRSVGRDEWAQRVREGESVLFASRKEESGGRSRNPRQDRRVLRR